MTVNSAASEPRHRPFGAAFMELPGGTWFLWRTIVLRSAGFPLRLVEQLADEALADTADRLVPATDRGRGPRKDREEVARYEREFELAVARAQHVADSVAQDPWFREAIAWQNRALLDTCLDAGGARSGRDSRARRREATIASYLQRYTTKNESIGYFGPIGWASWQPAGPAAEVRPGSGLLSRRTVHFESWAIDAVGAALAERPELAHGVPPRQVPANHVTGDLVHLVVGDPLRLTQEDTAILRLCDGIRTVREIAAVALETETHVLGRLRSLRERGLVCLDFGGPVDAFPERLLRQRLLRVPDIGARRAALADLARLVRGKHALASAAGNPDAVAGALDVLNQDFERLTGVRRTRLHGQTYAGRTIVYEDTTRDVEVRFGPDPVEQLAGPLSLVLDSGRWLAARIGHDCLARFDKYFEQAGRRSHTDRVPLARLLALATRDFFSRSRVAPVAAEAVAELQRRWARVLAVPPGAYAYEVAVADIAGTVAETFATEQPGWAGGLVHSPDVMIAASSVDAINSGDYCFVLGELHAAFNSVESRAIVEQSPDKRRLLSMAEAVAGGRRIMVMAPRAWGAVTARTSPPSALLSPSYVYWAVGTDDVCNLPATPIPVAALSVVRSENGLVVRCSESGRVFALVDVLGDYLSGAAVNAFHMFAPARHTPRVAIGRLVVARESWRMPARKCAWAFQLDERRRYLQMREWLDRHGIPRRAFYSVSIETKPAFVDFTSLPLVNVLASVVRRLAKAAPDDDISISEMLPDLRQTWLPDASGDVYTSELRLIAVESMQHRKGREKA